MDGQFRRHQRDRKCTLRSLLDYYDANGGGTVEFNIPPEDPGYDSGTGVFTIHTDGLPAITQPITVNGSTNQPHYAGTPIIDVAGESGEFLVSAGPNLIDDMAISGCSWTGVTISENNGNDTVQGCYIGVAPDSKTPSHAAAAGNLNYGVEITNSSSDTLNGDVISANQQGGVYITSGAQSNLVVGCQIGADPTGEAAMGNQEGYGVNIENSMGNTLDQDVISANDSDGVYINSGVANMITNCQISTQHQAEPPHWGTMPTGSKSPTRRATSSRTT